MPSERQQFRVLYRDFLRRLVDLEVLSPGGEVQNLLVQFAALLAAFNFVVAISIVPRYGFSTLPRPNLLIAAWGDEEFLIATTMAIAGLFAVLAWNAVFPDRRDSFVLVPLPVRTRTIFLAKIAAIGTALGVSVAVINIFTGISLPFVVIPPGSGALGALRSLGAFWLTAAAAGLFVCCALLAVQGLAAQLLTYRLFVRVSSFLQLAAFFVILGVYFLKPPLATLSGLTAPANQRLLKWLPSFWFLGLFQQLNGSTHPAFGPLAARAIQALLVVFALAAATYALAYRRNIRRLIEQPDITPGDRSRPAARIASLLAARLLPRPFERAILLFTTRTLTRSRQHRLILAAYGGIGLAIALAYTKGLLYGYSRSHWDRPNSAFLAASLVLLFFAVIGVRAVFALPLSLPSNWIFRVTAVHSPAAYFAAVRKSLLALTVVPVCLISALLYFSIWPGRPALEHLIVLVLLGMLLVEKSLYRFRKIPFACSYLPGRANLKVRLGAYGALLLFATEAGSSIESWALQRLARFVVLSAILLAAALWARRRAAEFAASEYNRIQFEDLPPAEVLTLDLHRDSAFSGEEAYVDAVDPQGRRSFAERAKPVAMGAILLMAAGFLYEQAGQWRDRKRFPQIGRSVDIGGRSLNIYCSGEGSPTVVLETTHGNAGSSWVLIQREIAKFTRACWYDRAGYGWSDPGPFPNHSDSIARDLHKLLIAARLPPPYILVGHLMGAFHVRVYNGFYSGEVAGLVLVDPFNEDTTVHIHNHIETLRPAVVLVAKTLGRLGWWRLLGSDPAPPPGLTTQEWATALAMASQAKTIPARISEPPMWVSGELARAAGGFGDLPLVVLSSGIPTPDWYTETYRGRLDLHAALAQRSTRGRHFVVPHSRDTMPYEAPEAVIEAVREVVAEIRCDHSG